MRTTTTVPALALCLAAAAPAAAGGYASNNVVLLSHIPLSGFSGNPSNGSDCWGYVSPSGREYALMGLYNSLAVVEITNPQSPAIIAQIPHSGSLWADVKVYDTYCYVTNETGGGLDVIDLSNVDAGSVSLVQRVIDAGNQSTHNVAIDTDSGYLYLCGSNVNGGRLNVFDLSDPADPVLVGQVSSLVGTYVHDAEIVTFTTGPNAGRQIAYCANGSVGLDIYDVTNKQSMFRLSRTVYPNLDYAHQCWLSDDGVHLYLNDELDGINQTVIFDVSDLSNPQIAGSSNSGVFATDHNLYLHEGRMYEAEYHAGLRVFDLADPLNPVQVGWFDTYPADDAGGFDGAWSVFPGFPSGSVLISDIQGGLFVVRVGEPQVEFAFPAGQPQIIDPAGDSVPVEITELEPDAYVEGSGKLNFDAGAGMVQAPLVPVGGAGSLLFDAVFPSIACATPVSWYVSADNTLGLTETDPLGAPGATYAATAATGVAVALDDDFEADLGWTVADDPGLVDGWWSRGIPVGGGDRGDPAADADGSGKCYLTDNTDGNSDVDGGATTLTSPVMDATAGPGDAHVTYWRWFSNDFGSAPFEDTFVIEISDDAGSSWTLLETVGPAGPQASGGWYYKSFRVADYVSETSQVQVRFVASDLGAGSIVEAAVDGVSLRNVACEAGVFADVTGDGHVGVDDFLAVLAAWGPCPGGCPPSCPADFVGDDCTVGVEEFLAVLANWSP